ncbi:MULTISPECIES: helix-turn-helix transcriptional regulator [unclassified Acinetobacter]|uniref:helix-turn-helix transcriptional regulator n=1 Tax=unclassified Acinetobacter TaxID=196816 RepID=UPI000A351265|nr:AlpA family transcriptional regulator [Acinetobacter sp. ANC 4218]OTG73589.1 hypothetical protein B9T38_04075 [Acinetobacter sp. ANC 4218]
MKSLINNFAFFSPGNGNRAGGFQKDEILPYANNEQIEIRKMKLLNLAQVTAKTSLSKNTVYVLMRKGEFPRPIRITEIRTAWLESDIEQWINERIQNSKSEVQA